MKKLILGILIAIVSMVILGVMITVVSFAAFAAKTDTKVEIKADTMTDAAVVSLSGNVINEISGEVLVTVQVQFQDTDRKTYTDFDGHFVIDKLAAISLSSV